MIRLSDVRYALRLWRRHPAMVAVAGLSLGLGVGATTTMYGVVNRVANYQLGFAEADRLAVLWNSDAQRGHPPAAADLGNRSRHARARPVVRVVRLLSGRWRAGHAVDDHRSDAASRRCRST